MFLTMKLYLCLNELFEIELFICIKMDFAHIQRLIYHKPKQTNKQTNKQTDKETNKQTNSVIHKLIQ